MKKVFGLTIVLMLALTLTVCASNKISPAIDVIASENSMIKASVLYNGEFGFDVNDFDDALGVNVKSITVTALPEEKVGRLMLDNLYIVENQVIEREDFSMIRYVQKTNEDQGAFFKFKPNNSDYELECSLKPIESVNLTPVASNGEIVSAWTNMNVSSFGALSGYDPEGDELKYEIVSYPQKGLVTLTNSTTGDYKYTPYENSKGSDAFTYRVRDSYGNYSEICTVKMKIEKLRTSLVFSDLEDERYLNAGIVLHQKKLMKFEKNQDGTYNFKPSEEVTKEELVALIMNVMGAKSVPTVSRTRFADDSDISPEYKGYLESAFSLGIISGTNQADGLHINPKSTVTLAEASVMINKIIGARSDGSLTVFADESDIPVWAKGAITSLTEAGILTKENGKISPNAVLTRAQTAQILMSLLNYMGKIKN